MWSLEGTQRNKSISMLHTGQSQIAILNKCPKHLSQLLAYTCSQHQFVINKRGKQVRKVATNKDKLKGTINKKSYWLLLMCSSFLVFSFTIFVFFSTLFLFLYFSYIFFSSKELNWIKYMVYTKSELCSQMHAKLVGPETQFSD